MTATVLKVCLVSATDLSFGGYDPTSATPLDAANTVTVTCTIGTPYNVGLDKGSGATATVTSREMAFSGNILNYSLYQEAGRTTVWGNTIGTDTVSATAVLPPTVHNVYGRVFSGQNVPVGGYSGTINVTVTY